MSAFDGQLVPPPNPLASWQTKGRFCLLSAQGLTSTEGGCLTSRAQREGHGARQNVNNKSPPIETESRSASRGPRMNNLKGLLYAKRSESSVHTYTYIFTLISFSSGLLHLFPIIESQMYLNTVEIR